MADGLKISIEVLDTDNYAVWAPQMQLLLMHKGLWKGVQDPSADQDLSVKAKGLIGMYVQRQHLGAILAAANAKVAWDQLKDVYQSKSAPRKLQLRRELNSLKQEQGEPVAKYVGRARDLARDLAGTGSAMADEDLAMILVAGLNQSFEPLVTVLAMGDHIKSIDSVFPQLQTHEQMMKVSKGLAESSESGGAVAYAAKGGAGKKGACNKCGKQGHYAKECRSGAPQAARKQLKCFVCDSTEHLKRDCLKRKEKTGSAGVAFTAGGTASVAADWFIDSGATEHMTGDWGLLREATRPEGGPRQIKCANEGYLEVTAVGTVGLSCVTPAGSETVTLQGVRLVPGLAENLLSVFKATEGGATFLFEGATCTVKVQSRIVLQADKCGRLYGVRQTAASLEDTCMLVRAAETPELWHKRLGHAAFETLAKMTEGGLVQGVGVKPEAFRALKTAVCEPCILGKQTRAPFPKQSDSPPTTEPLQLIHMDVCGPMPVASKGGKWYLATYLDDYSKLSVVEPIQLKSDVVSITEAVFARLELQLGKKVKAIQTDRGGKYVNKEMKALLGKKGIVHKKSVGNAPEQNGAAERLNRDLQEKGRAMLADSKLGPELWAEALVNANYTRNRLPSSVHGKTPYEVFHGKVPSVSHMRVFGAPAYMLIPKERREKMQPVCERAVFLGYEADSKAYRVQRVRDGRVMISRELVVNESATSLTVELSSGAEKGSEGARGLSRVSPPTQMGAGDTSAEESGTGREDRGDGPSARNRVHHTGTGAVQGQPAAAVGQQGQHGQRGQQQGQSEIDPRSASDGEAEGDTQPRRNPARPELLFSGFVRTFPTGAPLRLAQLPQSRSPPPIRKP